MTAQSALNFYSNYTHSPNLQHTLPGVVQYSGQIQPLSSTGPGHFTKNHPQSLGQARSGHAVTPSLAMGPLDGIHHSGSGQPVHGCFESSTTPPHFISSGPQFAGSKFWHSALAEETRRAKTSKPLILKA